jgi:hypothetical protein
MGVTISRPLGFGALNGDVIPPNTLIQIIATGMTQSCNNRLIAL